MQTQADGWSLTMIIHPKEVGKRMVMDRQKVKTRSESRRYNVADKARGQGRQNGQAGRYRVQKQATVKTGRTKKGRMQKAEERGNHWLTWKHTRQTCTERQETPG